MRVGIGFVIGALLTFTTVTAETLDPIAYDARLCTAGIVVLVADLERLDAEGPVDLEQDWLQQRVAGLAASLGWLCRRHALLNGRAVDAHRATMLRLRENVDAGRWREAIGLAQGLGDRMPPDFTAILTASMNPEGLAKAEAIYRQYCAACHLVSGLQQTPPVYSLQSMAREQPPTEFVARMIIGVHGTPEIGLRNPLSDRDIAGIYVFLRRPL